MCMKTTFITLEPDWNELLHQIKGKMFELEATGQAESLAYDFLELRQLFIQLAIQLEKEESASWTSREDLKLVSCTGCKRDITWQITPKGKKIALEERSEGTYEIVSGYAQWVPDGPFAFHFDNSGGCLRAEETSTPGGSS